MYLRKVIAFSILILFVALSGCSKDNENNPVAPKTTEPAKLQMKEVTVPSHLQQVQDPFAQMVNGFIQMVNSFKTYTAFFSPPSGAKHLPKTFNTEDEWTWTNGEITVRLVYNENDMIHWKVYLTGTYEGFTATNWLGMEAEQTKDGKSGHLIIYQPVTSEIAVEWDWTANADGSYSFDYVDVQSQNKINIVVNSDKSGTLKVYQTENNQSFVQYQINWTSTGSGQWWEYDASGNIVSQGSWT